MTYIAVLLAVALPSYRGYSDTIKTATESQKGTFLEFKENKFFFRTEKGESVEFPKASVREVIIDSPVTVSILRKGKSSNEAAELVGYDKLQFAFTQKKQKLTLSAMNVSSVKAQIAAVGGSGEGGTTNDGNTFIEPIPTADFDIEAMTDGQKSALSSYKSVRKRYDAFLSESSALVAEMDKSTGARRESLLGTLRVRKGQEQPIRIEMNTAHKALLAAFPAGFPLKVKQVADNRPAPPPPGESAAEVINETLEETNGEVLLIDTTSIAKSASLSDKQKKALAAYDDSVLAYQELSVKQSALAATVNSAPDVEKPQLMADFEQGEKDATASKNKVLKAQAAFLKAFPELRLTD